jgi:2',3'-cyclic-nucleotide 2'-phosphodiesterase (5'-nucleotidase family)
MPDHFSEGIRFTDGDEELPGYIKELKEEKEADLIVLVSHLGFPQELDIAERIDGIDVLLSAHTHNRLYEPAIINDTIIIQSGCHGSFLGRLDLKINNKKIVDYNHELILLDESIEKDKDMQDKVNEILREDKKMLDEKVGETLTDLARDRVLESTMDNLLLQSLMHHEKDAVLAFSNGWRYGAPIPKGDITVNNLWNIIPVNPPVSIVDLTGEELIQMMEENLERTFSKEPFNQMGGYVKRSLGLTLYFKIENPYGERIQELFVGDEKVDKDRVYKAVYVTSQGVPKKYGINRKNLDIHAIDALENYIKDKKQVSAELRGTITAV